MLVDFPREFSDGLGQCRVRLDQPSELIGVVKSVNRTSLLIASARFAEINKIAPCIPASIDKNRFSRMNGWGSKPVSPLNPA